MLRNKESDDGPDSTPHWTHRYSPSRLLGSLSNNERPRSPSEEPDVPELSRSQESIASDPSDSSLLIPGVNIQHPNRLGSSAGPSGDSPNELPHSGAESSGMDLGATIAFGLPVLSVPRRDQGLTPERPSSKNNVRIYPALGGNSEERDVQSFVANPVPPVGGTQEPLPAHNQRVSPSMRRRQMQDAARPALHAAIAKVEDRNNNMPVEPPKLESPRVRIETKENLNKEAPQSFPPVSGIREKSRDPEWIKDNWRPKVFLPAGKESSTNTTVRKPAIYKKPHPNSSDANYDEVHDSSDEESLSAQDEIQGNSSVLKGTYQKLAPNEGRAGRLLGGSGRMPREVEQILEPLNAPTPNALEAQLQTLARDLERLRDYSKKREEEVKQLNAIIESKDKAKLAEDARFSELEELHDQTIHQIEQIIASIEARDETIGSKNRQIRILQDELNALRAALVRSRGSWFGGRDEIAQLLENLAAANQELIREILDRDNTIQDLREQPCNECKLRSEQIADLEARLRMSERLRNFEPILPPDTVDATLEDIQRNDQRSTVIAHQSKVELLIVQCRKEIDRKNGPQAVAAAERAIIASKHDYLKNNKLLQGRCYFWAAVAQFNSGRKEYSIIQFRQAQRLGLGSETDNTREGEWMRMWIEFFGTE
ncbi:hypothetical protein F5884DRAFT_745201 [Xylogone sp. PMI_703]|nr:hypothetical protein F5884DRAFT_745201 [Xylogone sp. PMI_703]